MRGQVIVVICLADNVRPFVRGGCEPSALATNRPVGRGDGGGFGGGGGLVAGSSTFIFSVWDGGAVARRLLTASNR